MNLLSDMSIRTKLVLMTAGGIVFALFLAGGAFIANGIYSYRQDCVSDLTLVADMVGNSTQAALEFQDSKTAVEMLACVRNFPSIEYVELRDANGQVFATYDPPGGDTSTAQATCPPVGIHFSSGFLDVVQEVRSDDARIGSLWIRSNLDGLTSRILYHTLIALTALTLALVAGVWLAQRMQSYFTKPILELAGVMRRVEIDHDYGLRVAEYGRDELGILCEGFNKMLARTQQARTALQDANSQLESRVAKRTTELRVALEAAEASSRSKSQFLANMSHEIRTPMTAILGYADLLDEDSSMAAKSHEHLEVIRRNGRHLLHVINDILDVSKIEAGKMTVERVACNPCQIVADVVSLMRPRAKDAGLTLEVKYQGAFPEKIQSDPTRLHQVLTNLLGNAIKFTPKGGIELGVSLVGEQGQLQFDVRDTGIGLTPDQAARVFDAFSQADDTMTRRYGGTGLGLTISRSLARLLGGDLKLSSVPTKGSVFSVTVATGPLEDVPMLVRCHECEVRRTQEPERSVTALRGRVLLVEDGADNQLLISTVLKKAGLTVEVADNGLLGYKAAIAAREQGRPFDLVLMDMQMPVLDGYSATRRLREAGYAFPVVALTAHAMSHDAQKCHDAGCDGYTTKPINRKQLIALVQSFIEKGQAVAVN